MTQNNIKKESDNNQPKEKKKWWQYRKIEREEAGRIALLGFLGFIICYAFSGGKEGGIIGDIFGLIFWVCGIIWVVKSIQFKIEEKKIKDVGKVNKKPK